VSAVGPSAAATIPQQQDLLVSLLGDCLSSRMDCLTDQHHILVSSATVVVKSGLPSAAVLLCLL
jgi:hypothetical protein